MKKDGIFLYQAAEHKLIQTKNGDWRQALSAAALGQACVAQSPASFVITADIEKTQTRYAGRAERYVWLEAGHAAQNLHLQAVALGLGSVPIGAFRDEKVKELLALDPDRKPIYIIPAGHVR